MAIRVLVVDDSALMRRLLSEILATDKDIEVVGTAGDPFAARDKIKQLQPDVLTLDVEMPRMDGLTFLGNLMRLRPMPVVMISSLTARGAEVSLQALELGAVDVVAKPQLDLSRGMVDQAAEIITKVKAAATARPRGRGGPAPILAKGSATGLRTTDRVIAIGASTGGTEAVAQVLAALPPDAPGVVIAQHIPPEFSRRFAERLDQTTPLAVSEARDGDPILVGHAYVAPGQRHLRVERSGARYVCRVGDDEPVNRHRPSVDVLFASVADNVGANAIGVLLTGMGADGAHHLGTLRERGAPTIAQDRETSVVWGMPGEAVKRGAASEVLALERIAERLIALARRG
jgi:two-component system chemotaxis response regulator CheB